MKPTEFLQNLEAIESNIPTKALKDMTEQELEEFDTKTFNMLRELFDDFDKKMPFMASKLSDDKYTYSLHDANVLKSKITKNGHLLLTLSSTALEKGAEQYDSTINQIFHLDFKLEKGFSPNFYLKSRSTIDEIFFDEDELVFRFWRFPDGAYLTQSTKISSPLITFGLRDTLKSYIKKQYVSNKQPPI